MVKVRFARMLMLVVLALSIAGVHRGSAQSPTAIAIPTATAEGCDQVPAYLEARQQIFDEFLLDLEAVFPTVATPIMENGSELFVAIASMTPEQATVLAEAYDTTASKIAEVEAPPVARFYNEIQVQLYALSADVFEESSKSDLDTAAELFNDELVAIGEAVALAGAAATGVCPAFADIVELDQTQASL